MGAWTHGEHELADPAAAVVAAGPPVLAGAPAGRRAGRLGADAATGRRPAARARLPRRRPAGGRRRVRARGRGVVAAARRGRRRGDGAGGRHPVPPGDGRRRRCSAARTDQGCAGDAATAARASRRGPFLHDARPVERRRRRAGRPRRPVDPRARLSRPGAGPLRLRRRCRFGVLAAGRAGAARRARAAVVPRRLRPRPARLADVPHRPDRHRRHHRHRRSPRGPRRSTTSPPSSAPASSATPRADGTRSRWWSRHRPTSSAGWSDAGPTCERTPRRAAR